MLDSIYHWSLELLKIAMSRFRHLMQRYNEHHYATSLNL